MSTGPNNKLLSPIVGIIALCLYALNLAFWVIVLFSVAIVHFIIPVPAFRKKSYRLMQALPAYWLGGHDAIMKLTTKMDWQIEGLENLSNHDWYFLVANHQSWADILILGKVFNRKVPILKFFLKKELIWLPFAGQACWLLDFPFMARPSKSFLKKHPEMKGRDVQATREACEKFKQSPSTIINFLEGTRFNTEKQKNQKSPYHHLLKPKSAGMATALSVLEGYVRTLIDVTIIYPRDPVRAWDFFCGRMKTMVVKVRVLPIPEEFLKNFIDDRNRRAKFQKWINHLWEEKDQYLTRFYKRYE